MGIPSEPEIGTATAVATAHVVTAGLWEVTETVRDGTTVIPLAAKTPIAPVKEIAGVIAEVPATAIKAIVKAPADQETIVE